MFGAMQVSANMDTCSDPKLKIPITIGTVPMHDLKMPNELDQPTPYGLLSGDPVLSTQSRI